MSNTACRLCLSGVDVVDMFHTNLTNSERLRTCILLATGVNISRDDVVTKHVCASCCDTSVKLYKFRINALVNDRAWKVAYRQACRKSTLKVEEIVSMNTSAMEKLLDNVAELSKARDSYAVHPSIVQLFKTNQNLIIPNELLSVNLDARVSLKPLAMNDIHIDVGEQNPVDVCNVNGVDVDVVKVHEQIKRPCEDQTKEVEEKRLKLDNSIVTPEASKRLKNTQDLNIEPRSKPISRSQKSEVSCKVVDSEAGKENVPPIVEASKCLKNNPINESTPKDTGKVSYKIVESQDGKENDGGSNKIVLARVISNESTDDVADTNQPQPDNRSCPQNFPNLTQKVHHPRKSRPSTFLTDSETDNDFLLPKSVKEKKRYHCEHCNKAFNHKFKVKMHKLKMHELKVRKNCSVCKTSFRSSNALSHHQQTVCFKQLISHQPMLCLKRCDDKDETSAIKLENPTIALKLKSPNPPMALNIENKSEDDEVVVISDDEESTIDGLTLLDEIYIKSVFKKYKKKIIPPATPTPSTNHQAVQTTYSNAVVDKPFNIERTDEEKILVEGMLSALHLLVLPIKLHVEPELSARFEPKESKDAVQIEMWSGNIKQLSNKPVNVQQRPSSTPSPKVYSHQHPGESTSESKQLSNKAINVQQRPPSTPAPYSHQTASQFTSVSKQLSNKTINVQQTPPSTPAPYSHQTASQFTSVSKQLSDQAINVQQRPPSTPAPYNHQTASQFTSVSKQLSDQAINVQQRPPSTPAPYNHQTASQFTSVSKQLSDQAINVQQRPPSTPAPYNHQTASQFTSVSKQLSDQAINVQQRPPSTPAPYNHQTASQFTSVSKQLSDQAINVQQRPPSTPAPYNHQTASQFTSVSKQLSDQAINVQQRPPSTPAPYNHQTASQFTSVSKQLSNKAINVQQRPPSTPAPYSHQTASQFTSVSKQLSDQAINVQQRPPSTPAPYNHQTASQFTSVSKQLSDQAINVQQRPPSTPAPYNHQTASQFTSVSKQLSDKAINVQQRPPSTPAPYNHQTASQFTSVSKQLSNKAINVQQRPPSTPAPYSHQTASQFTSVSKQLSDKAINVQQRPPSTPAPNVYSHQPAVRSSSVTFAQNQPAKERRGHNVPQMVPQPSFTPLHLVNSPTVNFIQPINYSTQPKPIVAQVVITSQSATPASQTIFISQHVGPMQQPIAPTISFITSTNNAVNVVPQLPYVQQTVARNNVLDVTQQTSYLTSIQQTVEQKNTLDVTQRRPRGIAKLQPITSNNASNVSQKVKPLQQTIPKTNVPNLHSSGSQKQTSATKRFLKVKSPSKLMYSH